MQPNHQGNIIDVITAERVCRTLEGMTMLEFGEQPGFGDTVYRFCHLIGSCSDTHEALKAPPHNGRVDSGQRVKVRIAPDDAVVHGDVWSIRPNNQRGCCKFITDRKAEE